MTFLNALYTEFLKMRRTKITWIIGLAFCFAPVGIGFFMLIIMNPDLARHMGLLTTKAQLTIPAADWATYLKFTAIILGAGSFVLGIMEAFVFGREYMQGTAKNMLTLPVGRGAFTAAKLLVVSVWYTAVIAFVYFVAIVFGFTIGLPGWSPSLLPENIGLVMQLLVQTLLLGSVPAWMAILGRGILAPIGFTLFAALGLGQLFSHTGWGVWCPWSIPLLTAQAGAQDAPVPGFGSWIVLIFVFAAGVCAAWITLDKMDNTQ
ncbi:MAG: ABC transporter permease [Spirochaetales bacterium]|nr:ABC transporter permease [Spirochaetales bacterium]